MFRKALQITHAGPLLPAGSLRLRLNAPTRLDTIIIIIIMIDGVLICVQIPE